MIPIQLTLQGLYSYKEKQTIDFEPLIAAGLFGLFGAVGSGKSSILEAIMLALFNKTERLSINKDRNYNIMNLQSDVLYIDFIFYGGASNSQKYRAIYHTKRNSKNFNDVTLKERAYYQWHGNDWLPLNLENASSILGNMSYESFMKTVIIPQGKFREFVDQSTNERTKMLKELFPLDKFDLFSKTGKLLTQTKADLQTTEKLLEEIGEAGEEDITILQEEIVSLKTMQQTGSEKLKGLRKTEEELRQLKGLFEEYEEVADLLKQLYSEKEFFEKKENQLAIYTKAFTYFREKLTSLSTSTAEIKQKKNFVEELDAEIKTFSEALEHASGELVAAKENLKEIDKAKEQCEDLKIIIEIGKATNQAKDKQQEAILAEAALKEIIKSLELIKKQIAGLEEAIQNKEIDLQDIDLLKERKVWLEKRRDLEKEREEIQIRIKDLLRTSEIQQEKVKKILSSFKDSTSSPETIDPLAFLTNEKAAAREACDALQKEMIPLQVKQQLAAYSADLREGDPCPLCGAPHHPDPAEFDEVSLEIGRIEKEALRLTRKESTISELTQEIQQIHIAMAGNDELLKDARLQLEKTHGKIAEHKATEHKISEAFDTLSKVEGKLSELNIAQREQKFALEKVGNLRKKLAEKETLLEKKRNLQQQVLQDKVREEEKVNQLNQMLKVYTFNKFQNHSLEELNASRERGLNHIVKLNENHEKAVSKVQKLEQDLHRYKGQYAAEEKALSLLVEKTTQLDQDVQQLVKEKGFYSVAEIKDILRMPLNMDREKQEIEVYKSKLLQVDQRYKQLQKQINNREYLPAQYEEIIQEIEDLESEMNSTQSKISIRQREIEEIRQKIARRASLEKEQEALELRKQNLSELCNLFRGSGFINYVSSIYLSNLCKAANERFLKLTKNNLSLELNEQNDFIIRDYLNNGKTRLLKTLSGGQTFQASLCLALALAENVKALNQADQSFFFLDEGFGALDKNALRVVFDTLKTLRKENRVVGIISHVEELQQEIDVYLEVENDRETGSQVRYSWK